MTASRSLIADFLGGYQLRSIFRLASGERPDCDDVVVVVAEPKAAIEAVAAATDAGPAKRMLSIAYTRNNMDSRIKMRLKERGH